MRRMLYGLIIGGALLWAMSARGMTLEEWTANCGGWAHRTCIESGMRADRQGPASEREQDRQRELAREQTRGMALFGSGAAMINGMNQAMQNMQLTPVPPMVLSPPVQYAPTVLYTR